LNWKKRRKRSPLPRLVVLALFFLGGVLLGQGVLAHVPDATGEELKRYLSGFAALEREHRRSAAALLSALVLYLRYPLVAFFLGFSSVGFGLLPVAALVFGFFLSFSVCCFTAAFGGSGVLLALAAMGIRCAVTLPCFFLLAVPSFETSAALAAASFGRGRALPVRYGGERWLQLLVVTAVLLAGMCVDLALAPWLLGLAVEQIVI